MLEKAFIDRGEHAFCDQVVVAIKDAEKRHAGDGVFVADDIAAKVVVLLFDEDEFASIEVGFDLIPGMNKDGVSVAAPDVGQVHALVEEFEFFGIASGFVFVAMLPHFSEDILYAFALHDFAGARKPDESSNPGGDDDSGVRTHKAEVTFMDFGDEEGAVCGLRGGRAKDFPEPGAAEVAGLWGRGEDEGLQVAFVFGGIAVEAESEGELGVALVAVDEPELRAEAAEEDETFGEWAEGGADAARDSTIELADELVEAAFWRRGRGGSCDVALRRDKMAGGLEAQTGPREV